MENRSNSKVTEFIIIGFSDFQNCTFSFCLFLSVYMLTLRCVGHYITLIMNKRVCILGAASTWLGGFLASVPITTVSSNLNYCSSNIVNHIFCDIAALTQNSCGDKTSFCVYMRPESAISLNQGKILVVLYAYLIPLLNPIVYSFRNKMSSWR
ncbi:hypothetical protein GDO86_006718 [Hymenochirus boettgeri]|uniref:G-protein coupled receptors family 1 profile domain-containing protein n=1 Tax=Hymenochirus boettgeri TaxID=247094 RepID=A0A8T2JC30_9PIPI|nr:hypothetical protein GDO86_006718 [Hymenochirus boettgeri]